MRFVSNSNWIINCLALVYSLSAFALDVTESQKEALSNAIHRGSYRVKIVEKEHGGITQSVIILGETHLVNSERERLASQLLDQFEWIGAEGTDFSKLGLTPLERHLLYKVPRSFLETEDMEQLSKGFGSRPGPIMQAQERYLKKTQPNLKMVHLEFYEPIPQESLEWVAAWRNASKLAAAVGVSGWVLCTSLITQYFLPDWISSCINTASVLVISGARDSLFGYLDSILPECYRSTHQNIQFHKMKSARDRVMSKNIEKELLTQNQRKTLLVLVGAVHVRGIEKILVKDYGFQPVPLSSISGVDDPDQINNPPVFK